MVGGQFETIVRGAMDSRGLSLSALADATGVDRSRWYAWFQGKNQPQARTLHLAPAALGVGIAELMAPFVGVREGPATSDGAGLSDLLQKLDAQAEAITTLAKAIAALTGQVFDPSLGPSVEAAEDRAVEKAERGSGTSSRHRSPARQPAEEPPNTDRPPTAPVDGARTSSRRP